MNDAAARKMACVLGIPAPRTDTATAPEPSRHIPRIDFSEMFKTSGSR